MKDFNFSNPEVLKALTPTAEIGIEFVGSANSHFQSEPIMYDETGRPLPVRSDWEFELSKNLKGEESRISGQQDPNKLPHFLAEKELYLKRSKELGENMFRFSLDFGRLCPEEGVFDQKLMAEYIKLIVLIKKQGQEPFITLHHFTMPKFLLKIDEESKKIIEGGWEHPDVLKHFRFYIENVLKSLNSEEVGLVKFFMTFNEPADTPIFSYISGYFPPFKHHRIREAERILDKMAMAHDIAYELIKKSGEKIPEEKKPRVGLGYAWPYFDGLFSSVAQRINNHYMVRFERNGKHSDFIGVHYYFRRTSFFFYRRKKRDYGEHPSFGDIYPKGILKVLRKIHRRYPSKEIFVSEIGFADSNDHRKPFWLAETIRYLVEARRERIPVRVLLLWSLVNNFEWELGMERAKFGLFSEEDLRTPMTPIPNKIKSFEVWRAAVKALTDPNPESLQTLQNCYKRAREQYLKYEKPPENPTKADLILGK